MEYKETAIKGVFILEPRVFEDSRGYFFEAWKDSDFAEHVGKVNFINPATAYCEGCTIRKVSSRRQSWSG